MPCSHDTVQRLLLLLFHPLTGLTQEGFRATDIDVWLPFCASQNISNHRSPTEHICMTMRHFARSRPGSGSQNLGDHGDDPRSIRIGMREWDEIGACKHARSTVTTMIVYRDTHTHTHTHADNDGYDKRTESVRSTRRENLSHGYPKKHGRKSLGSAH